VWRNVWRSRSNALAERAGFGRKFLPGALVCACLLLTHPTLAAEQLDAAQLLQKADDLRTVNYTEFSAILQSLQRVREDLTTPQRDYLQYLEGWKSAYDGDNDTAIARLDAIARTSADITLRFRASTTALNVLEISKRYDAAFSRLNAVLQTLPQVPDRAARQQVELVAGQLYTEVGQIALALSYAQLVIDEDWDGLGVCRGGRVKEMALYEGGRIKAVGSELQNAIDACTRKNEFVNANAVELTAAKVYIAQRRYDDAIQVLQEHYDQVTATHNPRMIALFNAWLADAYRRKGVPGLAREFASKVTGRTEEFGEALVTAFRVLYEIAKDQGDFKAALGFHEQYAAADKAYLDDLSARHLAYQKVNHENIANKLQVDALNKQNHVLQLEHELSGKAVETSRLYISLLTMSVVFIGLWAYRTKRSQLHFQNLSRLDGLTGICNRPHFIEQAEKALEASRRTGEPICIILCDLDHFKSINDRYGHATGDFVLKRTVSACNVLLTKDEVFCRLGGEEFGVLLRNCVIDHARQRAEVLRVTIAGITAHQGTTKATVSASFGVSTTGSSGHELGQLLAHADAALYEAKRTGRNRVVVFGQPIEVTPLSIVAPTGDIVQFAAGRSSGG
jgi:diguanylate cyclase (GGDEF)-like protein